MGTTGVDWLYQQSPMYQLSPLPPVIASMLNYWNLGNVAGIKFIKKIVYSKPNKVRLCKVYANLKSFFKKTTAHPDRVIHTLFL